ncbi:MAG: hypothetical protein GY821_16835 [Gammaproteobacteria bacterium]|nr:hypothetical protein [Gammaproteobacteria bacterium]
MSFNKTQNPIQYLLNEPSPAKIFPDDENNPIRYASMASSHYKDYRNKANHIKRQIERTQLSPRTIRDIERSFLENGQYNEQYRAEDVYLFSILLANEQLKHLGLSNGENLQNLCNLLMEARKQRHNANNRVNDKINKIIQRTYKLLYHFNIIGFILLNQSEAEENEYNNEKERYLNLAENSRNDSPNIQWSEIHSTMQAVEKELDFLITNANKKYSQQSFDDIIYDKNYSDYILKCYTFKPTYQHLSKVTDVNSTGRYLFKNKILTNKLLIFLPSQNIDAIIKLYDYYKKIDSQDQTSKKNHEITIKHFNALNECIENFNKLEKMRGYAETLQANNDETKQKAGKKLATVCSYLTGYNSQKKASPEARECLKQAIDQTYKFQYHKNGQKPMNFMEEKLAYQNIANKVGKLFEPRGRWALLGWLGIILLLITTGAGHCQV